MKDAGENFPLHDDAMILKIDSPMDSVWGPYTVVFKDVEQRWAVVALGWGEDKDPSLGIRWFWDNGGNPVSRGYAIWFVIPESLNESILSGLPLDPNFRGRLEEFLRGKLSGERLNG
jgi:hypothetical protein